MEDNTRALEVVCRHFKTTYGDDTIKNLRRRLAKAYRRNSALNKELLQIRFQQLAVKCLNVFLLTKWRELVTELTALHNRIA